MLHMTYQRDLPFPVDAVISQYFDMEHIEHVHPKTLGRCELVEVNGSCVRFRQHWPSRRKTSLIDQQWCPPDQIKIRYVDGHYRGVELDTRFHAIPDGTRVIDTYRIPGLPNWGWVRTLARPWIYRTIDRIWSEDLGVGLPRGGWSGVPGMEQAEVELPNPAGARRIDVGRLDDLPDGRMVLHEEDEVRVLLLRQGETVQALDALCPHAGGPLERGQCSDGTVRCPWHGSRYQFTDGRLCDEKSGPSARSYPCTIREGVVEIIV